MRVRWDYTSPAIADVHRERVMPRSLFLLLLFLSSLCSTCLSIHAETAESHSTFTCEPVGLRMCQDLPYNATCMPNLLNHYDQQTAALSMEVRTIAVSVYMGIAFAPKG